MAFVAGAGTSSAQAIPWRLGRWNPDSFGNQRVVLHVADPGTQRAVRALIPWRRRDAQPEQKRLIVTNAAGQRVTNVALLRVGRDSGDMVFEPTSGAGDYYVYYLPYTGSVRSNYPRITYPPPDSTAMPEWIALARSGASTLSRAVVAAFEAVDSMSQRWPRTILCRFGIICPAGGARVSIVPILLSAVTTISSPAILAASASTFCR